MALGHVEITHDFSTITGKVIMCVFENSNPTAELLDKRQVLEPPHIAGGVIIVENLETKIYRFRFYESTDGSTLQTLLHSWAVMVKDTTTKIAVYEYVVDRGNEETNPALPYWKDPVHGDTSLTDERLADAEEVILFSRGIGLRQSWEYDLIPNGGWSLKDGEIFEGGSMGGDRWTAVVFSMGESTDTSAPPTSSSSVYNDVKVVNADEDFDTDYFNKNNIAGFATTIGITAFPAAATIASGTKARFSTFSGQQRYWKLVFTDEVTFNGEEKLAIWLGKNETIELFWKDGVCYVVHYSGDYNRIGQPIHGRTLHPNVAYEDGTEYTWDEMGRFYYDFVANLPAEQIVTYSQYDTQQTVDYIKELDGSTVSVQATKTVYPNRGKYAVDFTNKKFKMPDRRDITLVPLKNLTGATDTERVTQGVGGYQVDAFAQHYVRVPAKASGNGGNGAITDGSNDGQGTVVNSIKVGGAKTRSENYATLPCVCI